MMKLYLLFAVIDLLILLVYPIAYVANCDPTADREVLTASGSCSFCTLTTANRSRGFDVRKFAFAV